MVSVKAPADEAREAGPRWGHYPVSHCPTIGYAEVGCVGRSTPVDGGTSSAFQVADGSSGSRFVSRERRQMKVNVVSA
jgi:hypothetical protein